MTESKWVRKERAQTRSELLWQGGGVTSVAWTVDWVLGLARGKINSSRREIRKAIRVTVWRPLGC